jgi:hypothetical protein
MCMRGWARSRLADLATLSIPGAREQHALPGWHIETSYMMVLPHIYRQFSEDVHQEHAQCTVWQPCWIADFFFS